MDIAKGIEDPQNFAVSDNVGHLVVLEQLFDQVEVLPRDIVVSDERLSEEMHVLITAQIRHPFLFEREEKKKKRTLLSKSEASILVTRS